MRKLLRLMRRQAALLPLAMLLAGKVAVAQQAEEGPVFGVRRRPPTFGLYPFRGALNFETLYSNNNISTKGGAKAESSALSFKEFVDLATGGYIVHPNLVEYHLAGSFGLEQDNVDTPAGSESSDTTVYTWDINAIFLRTQELSGTVYTRRTESLINQPFGETFNSTDTTYGASLDWKSKVLPTTINAYRTETTQSSLTGTDNYTLDESVLEWHTDAILGPSHTLSWDYSFIGSDQSSDTAGATSVDQQTESLNHHIGFGPGYKYDLNSLVWMSQVTGPFERDSLRWDEMLHMRHTPNFQTEFDYSLDQESADNVDQTSQTATATFQHRLYQSLTSRGLFRYTNLDISGNGSSEATTWLAQLDENYQKKVPYGVFTADAGVLYSEQENQERGQELPVINQPITFTNFTPVIIQRPDIDLSTFKLHNATGFLFSPISDYHIFNRGNFVELQRQPTSLFLHEGQTAFADYLLEPEPANTLTTEGFNIGGRYNIEQGPLTGLTPYVEYYRQDQSFSANGPTQLKPDQVQDVRLGAEYFYKEVRLKGEYEMHDSTLLPFDAVRFQAAWNHRVNIDSTLLLEGHYEAISYSEPSNQQTTISASGSWTQQLTRQLRLNASVDWYQTEDDLAGTSQGLQEQLELNWRYRQIEVFMRFRNASLESDFQEQDFQLFQVGMRREF